MIAKAELCMAATLYFGGLADATGNHHEPGEV